VQTVHLPPLRAKTLDEVLMIAIDVARSDSRSQSDMSGMIDVVEKEKVQSLDDRFGPDGHVGVARIDSQFLPHIIDPLDELVILRALLLAECVELSKLPGHCGVRGEVGRRRDRSEIVVRAEDMFGDELGYM
jgi:hypothetical protein